MVFINPMKAGEKTNNFVNGNNLLIIEVQSLLNLL